MRCQERDSSLLLPGEGFAYDCAPPVVKFDSAARTAQASPFVRRHGARILQATRTRYASFNDLYACEKLCKEAIAASEGHCMAQICEAFLRAGSESYTKEGTTMLQRFLAQRRKKQAAS
jgi:hypothetical protein